MKTVELTNVFVHIGRSEALADISFSASAGERLAVFGHAGCGKSTLLRLLFGEVSARTGTVRILGRLPKTSAHRVGFATGDLDFPPSATCIQVLNRTLAGHDVPSYQRAARSTEMLEVFGLLERRERPIRELGGTHQIALSLAAALVHRPAVFLMDNLIANLPPDLAGRFWSFVNDRRSIDGLTVIHATTLSHESEHADRVLLMDSGSMLSQGAPAELQAWHGVETLLIEAADPESVRRTLRGIFDVVFEETADGLRISTQDAVPVAAHIFRHPSGGFRSVLIRRPSMWDVLESLRENRK